MNKQRRTSIQDIISQLNDLEALKASIMESIEEVMSEEQEYFDNMPEGLQMSDRGQRAEDAIGHLEDAKSQLEDLDVSGIQSELDAASE